MYYQKHKAQTRGDDSYGNKFEPLDIAIYLYRYSILLIDIVLFFIRYVEYVELFTSFSFVILIYNNHILDATILLFLNKPLIKCKLKFDLMISFKCICQSHGKYSIKDQKVCLQIYINRAYNFYDITIHLVTFSHYYKHFCF